MVTERKQHDVQQRDDVNGRITIPGSFNCFKALLALSCIISIHADGAQEVWSRSPHTLLLIYIPCNWIGTDGIQHCIGVGDVLLCYF